MIISYYFLIGLILCLIYFNYSSFASKESFGVGGCWPLCHFPMTCDYSKGCY